MVENTTKIIKSILSEFDSINNSAINFALNMNTIFENTDNDKSRREIQRNKNKKKKIFDNISKTQFLIVAKQNKESKFIF